MDWLIWTGAGVSMLGVAALIWCIVVVARAKRSGLPGDKLAAQLRRVIPVNMGALFLSAIGLMIVVIGITLG